jgi:ribosomal protein S18 acetylase RimI-like enzyme
MPEGITIRPLTFVDNLVHTETLVQSLIRRDVAFQLLERSPAAYVAARWAALPVYYHIACTGYGAFDGEKLAGMLYLRGWRRALHVDALAVHPDYRRRGVGRALLRVIEQQARTLRRPWLSLRVTVGNKAAVKLYKSEGFRPTHHSVLQIDGQALVSTQAMQQGKRITLRPLVRPGAHAAYFDYTHDDLAVGDAWAADILTAQMATRPPSYGRRRWLCQVDGHGIGYLTLRGLANAPRFYLATRPDWWGAPEEIDLLSKAMARLPRTPERIEVQLASHGHHVATSRAIGDLNPADQPAARMTMLKSLTMPANAQEEESHDGP